MPMVGTSAAATGEQGSAALTTVAAGARSHRRFRRIAAPSGAFVSVLAGSGQCLSVALRDLSAFGLGCDAPPSELPRFVDATRAIVHLPGWPPLALDTDARATRSPGEQALLGLEVRRRDEDKSRAWLLGVDAFLHPHTRTTGGMGDALWDLYARSGYFSIAGKKAAHYASVRHGFLRVGFALARAPLVGARVVWTADRGLWGAVAVLKPYARTWLDCQLARHPEATAPKHAGLRHLLLHALEYPQRDPDFHWLLTYVRHDTRFSRYLKQDFLLPYTEDPNIAAIVPMRALEASTLGDVTRTDASVRSASAADADLLTAHVAGCRPRAYAEALDLVPRRQSLGEASRAWRAAGLERQRELLVAERHGAVTAIAVLECAEPGSHLAGLLDSVRVFELGGEDDDACAALLEAARQWMRARGRSRLLYLCERPGWQLAERLGFVDMGRADTVVMSSALLEAQVEHLLRITA